MSKSVGDEDLDTFTRNCVQKGIEKYQPNTVAQKGHSANQKASALFINLLQI